MLARTAQSIYIRAGYDRERAFTQGRVIAEYVLAHLDECQRQFDTEDEFELARLLALAMLSPSSLQYAS
jgi:hypothetical protein